MLTHAGACVTCRVAAITHFARRRIEQAPVSVLAEAGLDVDEPVKIRQDRGRIIIEPERRKLFAIRDLVKAIRPGNLHTPVDTGVPVGREVW